MLFPQLGWKIHFDWWWRWSSSSLEYGRSKGSSMGRGAQLMGKCCTELLAFYLKLPPHGHLITLDFMAHRWVEWLLTHIGHHHLQMALGKVWCTDLVLLVRYIQLSVFHSPYNQMHDSFFLIFVLFVLCNSSVLLSNALLLH